MSRRPHRALHTPRAQRGVTLIIALIVLVAMTLAGVAMMRSVDTGSIVAGNIAFRQSSVNAADQGLQAGYTFILANAGGTTLNSDVPASGYVSFAADNDPDWMAAGPWASATVLNGGAADAGGNVVWYKIERLCKITGPTNASGQTCGSTPDTTAISGEGVDQSSPNFFTLPPATHYRITAKAVGPRNSITVVQTLLRSQ